MSLPVRQVGRWLRFRTARVGTGFAASAIRLIILAVVLGPAVGPVCAASAARAARPRPNVVLIMTDDQGYGDFGVMGNPVIKTPHLDAMARRSARMACYYVSPVCSPTRASLMTGRYNYRTRCIDTFVGRSMMDPSEVTVAEILRDAGYGTAIFGKWHLGDNYPMRAMDQGFEESLVIRGGGIGQPADPPGGEGKYTNPVLFHNGQRVETSGYCTDVYFSAALKWIERCHARQRNFFVYLPTNAPHTPLADVPKDWLRWYQRQDLDNDQFPQQHGHKLPAHADTDRRARIFAMISNIDDNVGRLFNRLEQLNLTNNTLVIFMVDNGPNSRRYVAGMRGMKTQVYEGGIRSPLFAQWTGVLAPGHSAPQISAHIDILPTILDACGVALPAALKIDGRSLWPLLTGRSVPWPDRTLVLQSHRGDRPVRYHNFAARNQHWKLLHASGFGRREFAGPPRFELYDMVHDPLEMHDLATQRPQIVAQMRRAYDAWFDDVSSTRPDNYAPPRIYVGTAHENPVVLTRQNWRHAKGRPWAPDSNGYWLLHVAQPSRFDIRLRFPAPGAKGTAQLTVAGQTRTARLVPDSRQCTFENVPLKEGNTRLAATLRWGDQSRGPWQVDVIEKR